MHFEKLVAVKNGKKWSWNKHPHLSAIKKKYQRTPENFLEKDGHLYLLELNTVRLNKAYSASLKICGSVYALVLVITGGEMGKEFNNHHSYITDHKFKSRGKEYITLFEKVIKSYGIYVGTISEDGVNWFSNGDFPIELTRIKSFYSKTSEKFYTVDGRLYYLRCISSVVEEMYFKCVAIAGSDYALARAFADDEKTKQQHVMNFKRLGFKQAKTFSLYAKLFSDYLQRNQPLFEVE